jgi:hypothetical protein
VFTFGAALGSVNDASKMDDLAKTKSFFIRHPDYQVYIWQIQMTNKNNGNNTNCGVARGGKRARLS